MIATRSKCLYLPSTGTLCRDTDRQVSQSASATSLPVDRLPLKERKKNPSSFHWRRQRQRHERSVVRLTIGNIGLSRHVNLSSGLSQDLHLDDVELFRYRKTHYFNFTLKLTDSVNFFIFKNSKWTSCWNVKVVYRQLIMISCTLRSVSTIFQRNGNTNSWVMKAVWLGGDRVSHAASKNSRWRPMRGPSTNKSLDQGRNWT